jgi:DNA mismatch repair ATPase MutL
MLPTKLLLGGCTKTRFGCQRIIENAVDAKATDIKLVIKDAGKALVQVIDNGLGMRLPMRDCVLSVMRHQNTSS